VNVKLKQKKIYCLRPVDFEEMQRSRSSKKTVCKIQITT